MRHVDTTQPAEATGDDDAATDAVLAASRLLVDVSARSLEAAPQTVTIAQFRLLGVLREGGPLKLSRLAARLGVNPSTVTRMVERLVAAGLVSREPNPASRRELMVDLTDSGRRTVIEVASHRRAEISRIIQGLPAGTRQELVRALTALTQAGQPEN